MKNPLSHQNRWMYKYNVDKIEENKWAATAPMLHYTVLHCSPVSALKLLLSHAVKTSESIAQTFQLAMVVLLFSISSPLTKTTGNPIGWLWNMTHSIWPEARGHFKAAQASRCTTLLYIYWFFLWPICCFKQGILDCYLLHQTLDYRTSAHRVYDLCVQTGHLKTGKNIPHAQAVLCTCLCIPKHVNKAWMFLPQWPIVTFPPDFILSAQLRCCEASVTMATVTSAACRWSGFVQEKEWMKRGKWRIKRVCGGGRWSNERGWGSKRERFCWCLWIPFITVCYQGNCSIKLCLWSIPYVGLIEEDRAME